MPENTQCNETSIKKTNGVLHETGHAQTFTPTHEAKYVGRVERGMLSKGRFRQ